MCTLRQAPETDTTITSFLCLLVHIGQEEVEAAVRLLDEEARKLARSRLQYKLMPAPLYAGAQTSRLDPTAQVGFPGVKPIVVELQRNCLRDPCNTLFQSCAVQAVSLGGCTCVPVPGATKARSCCQHPAAAALDADTLLLLLLLTPLLLPTPCRPAWCPSAAGPGACP
jgi:hypothetical protein